MDDKEIDLSDFNEAQTEIFVKISETFKGMTFREADKVLLRLNTFIRDNSVIKAD